MTSATTIDRPIYDLLPAHYRQRDARSGYLLRGVLEVIEDEFRLVEDDIETLYENWFIETCEPWVVPYLGDLLGAEELATVTNSSLRPRALVARVLEYRRIRGTAAGLEGIVRDVLGWTAHVVEYDDDIHQRHQIRRSPDVHHKQRLDGVLVDRPVDAERPYRGPGIEPLSRDIGLFIWRARRHALQRAQARPIDGAPGLYTVHALGHDTPLFNQPTTRSHGEPLTPRHLPGRLHPGDLGTGSETVYGEGRSLCLWYRTDPLNPDHPEPIAREHIQFGDLSGPPAEWRQDQTQVIIDPLRGRIALPTQGPAALPWDGSAVLVDGIVAASGNLGGGGYPRTLPSATVSAEPFVRVLGDGPDEARSLADALGEWKRAGNPVGIIRITASRRYRAPQGVVRIPAGHQLIIEAVDGARPVVKSETAVAQYALRVWSEKTDDSSQPASFTSDGVTIEGLIEMQAPVPLRVELRHCTVLPPVGDIAPALVVAGAPTVLDLSLTSCLVGPIEAPAGGVTLSIRDSIVTSRVADTGDGIGGAAIAADSQGQEPGPDSTIERSTVFGVVNVRTMPRASNTIFVDRVQVAHRQVGVMRYCYVLPPPPRANDANDAAGSDLPRPRLPARVSCIPTDLDPPVPRPVFVSTRVGDPAFAQLAQSCPRAIRTGADDGGELGALHTAGLARREDFLHTTILADYVPAGLETDVFYVD